MYGEPKDIKMKSRIYLIGNAGILIESQGKACLIDGLYDCSGTGFHASPIPESIYQDLFEKEGKLPKPDYLIFSHCHFDHYSKKLLCTYLAEHRPRAVFLPDQKESLSILEDTGNPESIRYISGNYEAYQVEKEIEISFIKTRHLGKNFGDTLHFCVILEIFRERFLLTADVDFFSEDFQRFPHKHFQGIFVNPLFYHHPVGQDILLDIFSTEYIFVYHLPFTEDDQWHLQHMVTKDIERYNSKIPVIPFQKPGQTFRVERIWEGGENL